MSGAKEMNYSQRMKVRTAGRGRVKRTENGSLGESEEKGSPSLPLESIGPPRSTTCNRRLEAGNFERKYVPREHQIMILWILIPLSDYRLDGRY
ncbi:hypothetical protein QLX08_000340 [Tetragonisca angustula]|uniref:Uncharacterized protein n=1 Tax=Tetragonisca angustula TaxID=166442 RepID=A0AAW1AJC5_9HYME